MSENNEYKDGVETLMEDILDVCNKSELLKKDAEFNLEQVVSFVKKHENAHPETYNKEQQKELFSTAKVYLGRLKITAQEQRKLDELYNKIRIKLNTLCGKEVIPEFPKEPYADELIEEMFKNDPTKWWEGV